MRGLGRVKKGGLSQHEGGGGGSTQRGTDLKVKKGKKSIRDNVVIPAKLHHGRGDSYSYFLSSDWEDAGRGRIRKLE